MNSSNASLYHLKKKEYIFLNGSSYWMYAYVLGKRVSRVNNMIKYYNMSWTTVFLVCIALKRKYLRSFMPWESVWWNYFWRIILNFVHYHQILLLRKFIDILGKGFKQWKIMLQPQKKNWGCFFILNFKNLHEKVRIFVSLIITKLFIDTKTIFLFNQT